MALDQEAKDAGITVFNEIGLDPGLDHLYAVKTIDEVHKAGGKINAFLSYCGGLPAPEASDNPLGYKFSWSPRGVLLAARNTASFYKDGKKETTPGPELMSTAKPYYIYPGYAFWAYPNRDSTPFRQRYAIPEAQTVIRGTLRYQGNPTFVQTLVDLGFLSEEEQDYLKPIIDQPVLSWKEATAKIVGATSRADEDLVWAISSKAKFASTEEKNRIIAGLKWIGLFSDESIEPRGSPLDCLCASLEKKMQYEKGERDFVMLQHKFEIEWADGKKETRTSTLCEYGEPEGSGGYSAMAKLVGVPCAVAVLMVRSKIEYCNVDKMLTGIAGSQWRDQGPRRPRASDTRARGADQTQAQGGVRHRAYREDRGLRSWVACKNASSIHHVISCSKIRRLSTYHTMHSRGSENEIVAVVLFGLAQSEETSLSSQYCSPDTLEIDTIVSHGSKET